MQQSSYWVLSQIIEKLLGASSSYFLKEYGYYYASAWNMIDSPNKSIALENQVGDWSLHACNPQLTVTIPFSL